MTVFKPDTCGKLETPNKCSKARSVRWLRKWIEPLHIHEKFNNRIKVKNMKGFILILGVSLIFASTSVFAKSGLPHKHDHDGRIHKHALPNSKSEHSHNKAEKVLSRTKERQKGSLVSLVAKESSWAVTATANLTSRAFNKSPVIWGFATLANHNLWEALPFDHNENIY